LHAPIRPSIEVARVAGPWIGRLGLRLTLLFVAVALAAVAAAVISGSVATSRDADQLITKQRTAAVMATSVTAAAAYDHAGWARADLTALTMLVSRAGGAVQVRDKTGRVVHASRDFAAKRGDPELTAPISLRGLIVGSVTLRFGQRGLAGAIEQFQAQRWAGWIMAAGLAALIALITALLVSHRIARSLDRLIKAARARGNGDRAARAGDVGGFGEIRELAVAFDQMADTRNKQDRLRRNLVADVAHELRTPIAVLQAGHEAMLDGLTEPTPGNVASLRDETLRLARMVDDLQRLASAEAAALQLKLTPCSLATIAQDAADNVADSFDAAGINLSLHLAEARVLCDPPRLREVATNLLTNALKFTPPGGTVLIETGPKDPLGQQSMLSVSDTGIGIAPEDLPKVTERFFRSSRTFGHAGSGIGLTIVAEVVQGHHGTMDIASELGSGTKVTITLPSQQAPNLPRRRGIWNMRRDGDRASQLESGKTDADGGTTAHRAGLPRKRFADGGSQPAAVGPVRVDVRVVNRDLDACGVSGSERRAERFDGVAPRQALWPRVVNRPHDRLVKHISVEVNPESVGRAAIPHQVFSSAAGGLASAEATDLVAVDDHHGSGQWLAPKPLPVGAIAACEHAHVLVTHQRPATLDVGNDIRPATRSERQVARGSCAAQRAGLGLIEIGVSVDVQQAIAATPAQREHRP